MDKDRIDGAKKQAKGSIREAIGKISGDKMTEAEGAIEKTGGQLQKAVGEAKDAARAALKKPRAATAHRWAGLAG